MATKNEPDWEQVCAHVKIGDPDYWPCAARREDIEALKEIREEAPFEERLMQRAQPVPKLPRARGARELDEEEMPKKREKRVAAEPQPKTGLLEQFVAGDLGKYVMWAGPLVLLGLYLWSRRGAQSAQPALPAADSGKVWAYGVVWKKVDGSLRERLFKEAQVAIQFAQALRTAGATEIQVAQKPVQILENDERLLQAAA